ncbi:MAG: hypothetical protein P4L46_01740 [Fimbriimonas sp.]|nr:hypothetical protein [Fimbriimonas sp.]
MFEVLAQEFTSAVRTLNHLSLMLREFGVEHPEYPEGATIPPSASAPVRKGLQEFEAECRVIGANASAEAVETAIKILESPAKRSQMNSAIQLVTNAFHQEAASWYDAVLKETNARLLHLGHSAVDEFVLAKFPGIHEDYDEAVKCLAAARPTAAVFHLMRIMEVAIRVWADSLDIPRHELNTGGTSLREQPWSEIMRAFLTRIETMPSTTEEGAHEKQMQEAALVRLNGVASEWQHSSLHPASRYTASQADEVFDAARAFLPAVAEIV